ncbi:hypothetical protein AB0N73_07795 [Microbacterium sp. NPDC089189]|uniref:hypothetical protein n=1 Tax=Microbacterium sp. NPDC089189 TaxID=3154972 RepID=UPI00342C6618
MHEKADTSDTAAPRTTIGDLFEREPPRWGVRGDVHLWRELQSALEAIELPASRWAFQRVVEDAWRDATGVALNESATPLYVERLDPGHGMSAGQVSPAWWHATGMMILLDRYFAATGNSP